MDHELECKEWYQAFSLNQNLCSSIVNISSKSTAVLVTWSSVEITYIFMPHWLLQIPRNTVYFFKITVILHHCTGYLI